MKKKIIIGVIVSVGIILFLLFNQNETHSPNTNITYNEQNYSNQIVVEIKGEVNRPGVYLIDDNERLYSLIKVAGGLTGSADSNTINLAQKLSDGMVITIPKKQITSNEKNIEQDSDKVSINNATITQLMTLKGIGESRAKNIINYRNNYGPFVSLEGLLNVPGISETIFNQIKNDITL